MARNKSAVKNQEMDDSYLSGKQISEILVRNNSLLQENNKLLREVIEMLHKIAINTS